ncbi:hypothetical protein L6164_034782 [Bauhinia variegata]|nr:hypothetical protein L6164_034782 [Bauhinia variegata]
MTNDPFSFTAFNFNGIYGDYDSIQKNVFFQGKHNLSEMDFHGEYGDSLSNYGKEDQLIKGQNQQQKDKEPKCDNLLEDLSFDPLLQPTQPIQQSPGHKIQGPTSSALGGHKPLSSYFASLELLSNYGSRCKKLKGQETNNVGMNNEITAGRQKLSIVELIRMAGERYVQFSANCYDDFYIPMHPYGFGSFGTGLLSEEESREVELAQFLLAAAEKVGCQQYERASRLLLHCHLNSSARANPVQRVIFSFVQALRERIDKETGRFAPKGSEKNEENELINNLSTSKAVICHQKIPFNQVMQLTGTQAIVENVASQTKIHLIDLCIRSGVQCSPLMKALAEREEKPVELLKITAIGYSRESKLEENRKRLASFAESLNLPFSYKVILVKDAAEINEDQFEIEEDEAVVVYSPYILRTMVAKPECLENLMRVLRNIKPSIMIVLEVEANHNSPSFVNRFIEALFSSAAFFDCLDDCLKDEPESRMAVEMILNQGIRNIVAMESKERTVRDVKIDVWRKFFARYRMVETEFSEASMYQASLVLKRFAHGNSCNIDKNGKCLILGWKGTPMHSLSAWRFL